LLIEYGAAAIIGYLLGSVPFSTLVARAHGVDLYLSSDGNPGAWNALEQLGARRAWPAFAGDGLKGTLAGFAGLGLAGTWGAYVAVGAAMLGHAFPLFARFRGGKAVMTFVGGGFAFAPAAAAIALGVCVLTTFAARSFAVGARVGVFSFPLIQLVLDPVVRVAATGVLMTLVGLLFFLKRDRSARASSGSAATPTS
jgi:acyl phosphate:glycerol-3-phosphate acyltransferase